MLLQRNIIYLLTLICLSSFAGLFTPWQVVVNVCTGLFSGAFIGVITSIAQYNKIRNDYFRSLYMLLTEYYKVFRDDENLITQSVDYLRQHLYPCKLPLFVPFPVREAYSPDGHWLSGYFRFWWKKIIFVRL